MYSLLSVWNANRRLTKNGWFTSSKILRSASVCWYCLRVITPDLDRTFMA